MTQTEVTPNPILEAARKLQEAKLVAVQGVVDTRSRIDVVVNQLTEAQREDAVAYQKALRAGWTEDELRRVGIAPPAKKAPGRPRSAERPANGGDAFPVGA